MSKENGLLDKGMVFTDPHYPEYGFELVKDVRGHDIFWPNSFKAIGDAPDPETIPFPHWLWAEIEKIRAHARKTNP